MPQEDPRLAAEWAKGLSTSQAELAFSGGDEADNQDPRTSSRGPLGFSRMGLCCEPQP